MLRLLALQGLFALAFGQSIQKPCPNNIGLTGQYTGTNTIQTAASGTLTDGVASIPASIRCSWKIAPTGFVPSQHYLNISITQWDFPSNNRDFITLIGANGEYLTSHSERLGPSTSPFSFDAYGKVSIYTDEVPVTVLIDSDVGGYQGFTLTWAMVTRTATARPCQFVISDLSPAKATGTVVGSTTLLPGQSAGTSIIGPKDCWWTFVTPPYTARSYVRIASATFQLPGGMEWFAGRIGPQPSNLQTTALGQTTPSTTYPTTEQPSTPDIPITFHWRNTYTGSNPVNFALSYYVDRTTAANYACAFYFNDVSGTWSDGFNAGTGDYHTTSLWTSYATGSAIPCYYIFNRQPGYRTLTVTLNKWDTPQNREPGYWFWTGCFVDQYTSNFNTSGPDYATSSVPILYTADADVCLMFAPVWGVNPIQKVGGAPWKGFGGTWAHSNADASVGSGYYGGPLTLVSSTTSGSVTGTTSGGGNATSTSTTGAATGVTAVTGVALVPNAPNANAILGYWWGLNWWATSPQGILSTGVPNGIFYPSSTGYSGPTGPLPANSPTAATSTSRSTTSPTSGTTATTATTSPTTGTTATNSPTTSSTTRATNPTTSGTSPNPTTSANGGTNPATSTPNGGPSTSAANSGTSTTSSSSCTVTAEIACCGSSQCPSGQDCLGAGTVNAVCSAASPAPPRLALF